MKFPLPIADMLNQGKNAIYQMKNHVTSQSFKPVENFLRSNTGCEGGDTKSSRGITLSWENNKGEVNEKVVLGTEVLDHLACEKWEGQRDRRLVQGPHLCRKPLHWKGLRTTIDRVIQEFLNKSINW